ncbi:MAG TPA: hypothetical protein VF000_10395 [Agromyces sp.]|jgi:hypothetical protein
MDALMHCDFSARDFTATAVETSDGRLVHVAGSGLCPTSGWELRLTAANPGVVPHPGSLWLELRESPPARRIAHQRTRTVVEAIIEDSQASEIVIRFRWRDPIVVPVRAQTGRRVGGARHGSRRADAAGRRIAASV